ncbi:MAG: hypothetical protein ACJ73E_09920 [Mycobacteriales bacterium]
MPAQRRLIPPLPPPARPVNGHPAPATGSAAAELNGLAQPQARLAPPARPGPTPPPTPGIDHLSWGGSPSRRRTVITAGIAVLVVVAAVLIPYLVHRSRDDGIGATAPVTPPAASTAGPASPEPAAPPPAGFRLHRDPTGFSIAVPTGWREERDGSLVDFRDPTSSRFIRIDQRNNPRTDPYDDWIRQEPTSKQRLPGYDLIRIGAVQYRGWPTADWEFTWGPRGGQRSHVRIRNVVPNDFHGYAIYWSTTDGQWTQDLPYFDVLVRTFAPKEER